MKFLIGKGQLNWATAERRMDRYGTVMLFR